MSVRRRYVLCFILLLALCINVNILELSVNALSYFEALSESSSRWGQKLEVPVTNSNGLEKCSTCASSLIKKGTGKKWWVKKSGSGWLTSSQETFKFHENFCCLLPLC